MNKNFSSSLQSTCFLREKKVTKTILYYIILRLDRLLSLPMHVMQKPYHAFYAANDLYFNQYVCFFLIKQKNSRKKIPTVEQRTNNGYQDYIIRLVHAYCIQKSTHQFLKLDFNLVVKKITDGNLLYIYNRYRFPGARQRSTNTTGSTSEIIAFFFFSFSHLMQSLKYLQSKQLKFFSLMLF